VDVGFRENNTITCAAIAVLDFQTLEVVETALAHPPTTFPYIPGLLSFREVPCVLEAMPKPSAEPDLLLYDGQGIAHPLQHQTALYLPRPPRFHEFST
jgi:deoxyribonuclease V